MIFAVSKKARVMQTSQKQLKAFSAHTCHGLANINSSTWFHALDCEKFSFSSSGIDEIFFVLLLRSLIKSIKGEKSCEFRLSPVKSFNKFKRKSSQHGVDDEVRVECCAGGFYAIKLMKCRDKCRCLRHFTLYANFARCCRLSKKRNIINLCTCATSTDTM